MAVSELASSKDREEVNRPDDRCGYVFDLSTFSDVGASCCFRPSREAGERCVWHAGDEDIPAREFEELVPERGERLDGAFVPEIKIVEEDWFEECSLIGATFDSTLVHGSSFAGSDLREAELTNLDARGANFTGADLTGATIESTDFRDADFHDARFDQAIITNTRVNRQTTFGETTRYEQELHDSMSSEEYRVGAEAAIWTYREIHGLFVENALPTKARKFYYKEKDTRRRLAWHMANYGRAIRAEAARWVTGYGMNPYRVVATSIVVMLVSAFLFPLTGGLEETAGQGEVVWSITDLTNDPWFVLWVYFKSLYFSIVTFTTLGYGDISPLGNTARALAAFEALLGALLTALLVFVLARRIS